MTEQSTTILKRKTNMKLTNTMRESFIDSVMNGIPVVNKYNTDDTMQEIRLAIESQLPKDILQFANKYPNLIIRKKYFTFVELRYVRNDGTKATPYFYTIDHDDAKRIDILKWVYAKERYDIEQAERATIRQRISDVTYSCTTLAKLKAALPELESYMPAEREVVKNLPIATGGLITDLLNVGLKVPK